MNEYKSELNIQHKTPIFHPGDWYVSLKKKKYRNLAWKIMPMHGNHERDTFQSEHCICILHLKVVSFTLHNVFWSAIYILIKAYICMIAIMINKPDSTKPFLFLIRERFNERKLAMIKRRCGREVSFRSQKCWPSEFG